MRLIDANVLIDKMDIMISNAILADTAIPYALIRELIAESPTIEPEVRHGRWNYRHEDDWCYCTACGKDADVEFDRDYCPHCGARMDGGDDNG